jgi:hypothetical protein
MKPVYIKKEKNTVNQSKTHAKYQNLLSEIERKQQYNANIRDGLHKTQAKINEELSPLEKEIHQLNRTYIIRLDELSTQIGLGKFNREWFDEYMGDELDMLLDFFGHQDKVLSKLYEKYLGVTPKEIAADDDIQETIKSLSDLFGFKVDIDEFLQKGERNYFEEYKHKIIVDPEDDNNPFAKMGNDETNDKKKKGKNPNPAEEDVNLAKDARNIYMRLVKKFHPDLENDAVLRDQKTEIIKKVTTAYQEKDFFSLLKLQITYLDDNETEAVKIADDMLKSYNKILQKQLDEINRRLNEMRAISGNLIEDFIDKNGKFSAQKFTARKRAIDKSIAQLKLILDDSKKRPKGWFKDQIGFIKETTQQKMMENIFDSMFNDFDY